MTARRAGALKDGTVKNGELWNLSISAKCDRSQQATHKPALAPMAETTADRNSYSFREGRWRADVVAAEFNALSKPNSATWVLEEDIQGCSDNTLFACMLKDIPMDRARLQKWSRTGYVENGLTYPLRNDVPLGGIINPTL